MSRKKTPRFLQGSCTGVCVRHPLPRAETECGRRDHRPRFPSKARSRAQSDSRRVFGVIAETTDLPEAEIHQDCCHGRSRPVFAARTAEGWLPGVCARLWTG